MADDDATRSPGPPAGAWAEPLGSGAFPVDRSKLLVPAVPPFAVGRPELVRTLDEATTGRLTLLVAPAGYGKSVLLGQWAANQPDARLAWLTIDPADTDAVRFGHHLVAALGTTSADFGLAALERLEHTGLAMGHEYIGMLLTEAADLPDTTLVLEDFNRLPNAAIVEEVGQLLERLPPNLHVVLSTRTDPGLPLGRLRTLDAVVELRQDQLSFTPGQTRSLVERVARRTVSDDQAELLHGKTEGWPAGLQLAALSLRGLHDVDPFLHSFAGDDRAVADYLTEEVLQRQSERVQRFLLQTSVLERLNGALCDAVVGGTGSQQLLEQLDRQSLFVHRLDNTRQWFRYHRLFQDLLRHRLRILDPQLERALLARAAEWQLANGALEPAARYLIAAGAWERIGSLVEERGREMFELGRAAEAARRLDVVPRERAGDPRAALMRVFLHSAAGVPLVAAQEADELEAGGRLTDGEEAVLSTLRSAWAQYHAAPSQIVGWADRGLAVLDTVEPGSLPNIFGLTGAADLRFMALASRARAFAYQGSTERARSEMQSLLAEPNAIKPVWMVHLLGSVALLESWSGHLDVARSCASRALEIAQDGKLTTQGSTADAYLAMACVARERNRLAEAEHFLDEALVGAALNRRHVLLAVHASERALTALAKGEPERGLAVLDLHQSEGHPPPPPAVADRLLGARVRLLVARGDVERALQLVAETPVRSAHVSAAATSAAVAGDRVDLAAKLVGEWPPGETRDGLEHELWSAILDDLGGHRQHAVKRMADVVARADHDGHLRLFLDNGPPALRLVRAVFHERPSAYLRSLLDPVPEPVRAPAAHRHGRALAAPLSDRERIVLGYLPSRLSNAEIARQLYISVNTLKTHIRRIYDKLEVGDRNAAVARAEDLGLVTERGGDGASR